MEASSDQDRGGRVAVRRSVLLDRAERQLREGPPAPARLDYHTSLIFDKNSPSVPLPAKYTRHDAPSTNTAAAADQAASTAANDQQSNSMHNSHSAPTDR